MACKHHLLPINDPLNTSLLFAEMAKDCYSQEAATYKARFLQKQCCLENFGSQRKRRSSKLEISNSGVLRYMQSKTESANYPPPPASNIELWVSKSIHKSWKTQECHIYRSLQGIGQNWGTAVVADSSALGNPFQDGPGAEPELLDPSFHTYIARRFATRIGAQFARIDSQKKKTFAKKKKKKKKKNQFTAPKDHDSQRSDRIPRFFLGPKIGQFSPHFEAIFSLNYAENLEKKQKIHWRNKKKPVETTAHRNCRFLCLVVVELMNCFMRFARITRCLRFVNFSGQAQEPPPSPFWQLTRIMV